MSANPSYGLEQARIQLPAIIADAHSGVTSVITRHGKPYAAVVPFKTLEKSRSALRTPSSLLALRGTGQGLWGPNVGRTIDKLRGEWDGD